MPHLGVMTSLYFLNLSGNCQVTDAGMRSLKDLEGLSKLYLDHMHRLSDHTLTRVIAGLTKLTVLGLRGCTQFTARGKKRLQAQMPHKHLLLT